MAKGGILGYERPQMATRKAAFCRPGGHRTHKSGILSDTYFLFCLKIHTKAKYHNELHKPQYAYTYQYSNVPIINQHLPKNGIPSIHTETQTKTCSI